MSKLMRRFLLGVGLLCCGVLTAHAADEPFVGVWDGTAGDPRVDEQWRITHVNGKWAVSGFYFWNAKGVAEDSSRVAGTLAGKFESVNPRVENGALKFTQNFDPKPIAGWADNVEIEATASGRTIVFKNRFVSGVKLEMAGKAGDCK